MRFAPNVLVSMTSAPARTYSRWTSPTRSACDRFRASKERLTKTPFAYSIVPIAPSQTRTRASRSSMNFRVNARTDRPPSRLARLPVRRLGAGLQRHEHVGLVPDEVLVAVDGGLVVLAHENGRNRTR